MTHGLTGKESNSGLVDRQAWSVGGNGICWGDMLDITVGMTSLCFRERIISPIFRGERRWLSLFLFSLLRGWFSEFFRSRPLHLTGTVLGKQHPLEERVCVSGGAVTTISRTLACSLPRGLDNCGWSVSDCLSTSDSHHHGEQSCLAVGGGMTAGSSR